MKIAIFGDSFADDQFSKIDEKCWTDVLRENQIEILNFSESGTSLMWSYKRYLQFKKFDENEKVDKIIFLITAADRITTSYKDKSIRITNHESFDEFIKVNKDLNKSDVELIQSFKKYFIHFHNSEEAQILKDLIMQNIISDNRVIYLDPFKVDLPENQMSLYDISREEVRILFKDPQINVYEFMNHHMDARKCHMTEPNNRMVGKKFLQAILWGNRTIEIFSNDFVRPFDKIDQYFIPYDKK